MTTPQKETILTPRSPRQVLTGELPGVLSVWERTPLPETARDLLAIWAGLQRLAPGEPDEDEDRLNALVSQDAAKLGQTACQKALLDADRWLGRAEELARVWETTKDPDELDWQAYQLFERVDRAALALWAVEKLGGGEAKRAHLDAARQALARADEFVAQRVGLFRSLAADAAEVLQVVRPGLEEQEPGLWETLRRHRRIKESAGNGSGSSPDRPPLPPSPIDTRATLP
jgi:hypothetical protein